MRLVWPQIDVNNAPEWGSEHMSDIEVLVAEVAAATDRESWLVAMDKAGEAAGYFQRAGKNHWACFADAGTTLLVGFETIDSARKRPDQRPLVQTVADRNGWSHLTLIADGQTFWRDEGLWSFMDRLIDDAFFEDFDRVLFYGAGPAGYAAAAYAVAAPGAQVLLLAPRATMTPALAGWDPRDAQIRRRDFTTRFGYAPDMVEGAGQVFLIYDPHEQLDAMHAVLFRGPQITHVGLPRANAGGGIEATLMRLGVLVELIEMAAMGRLTRLAVTRGWRKRRDDASYLKATLIEVAEADNPRRELQFCRAALARVKVSRIARHMAEIQSRRR